MECIGGGHSVVLNEGILLRNQDVHLVSNLLVDLSQIDLIKVSYIVHDGIDSRHKRDQNGCREENLRANLQVFEKPLDKLDHFNINYVQKAKTALPGVR